MDKCIFCSTKTSFIFEGSGEYNGKPVCPKCQTKKFGTKFSTGCATDDCSIKIERPKS